MVVEGAADVRLAIECDGDEYHGPDRWQDDMNRQRVLERAGWTFWRCFASTWSLRQEEVLGELLDRLSAQGIEPIGAAERIPSFVEKRVWTMHASSETEDEVAQALGQAISASQKPLMFRSNDGATQRTIRGEPELGAVWREEKKAADEQPRRPAGQLGDSLIESRAGDAPISDNSPIGFLLGSRVRHPKYGDGTIVAREGEGADAKLTISFSGIGLKKFLEKYSGLKPT